MDNRSALQRHQAFCSFAEAKGNCWRSYDSIGVPLSDLGWRQGVTVVERLRTYQGQVFLKDAHLDRLTASLGYLGLLPKCKRFDWSGLIDECLHRNSDLVEQLGDVGVTLLVTPGVSANESVPATVMVHLNELNFQQIQTRLSDGQVLVRTQVVSPPLESWSRQIKVRCRLHYFRADQIARQLDPAATGCLVDVDGSLTETSIANIALLSRTAGLDTPELVVPQNEQVLAGVTASYIRQLASEQGISVHERRIRSADIRAAAAVLLMGTDTGLWHASQVIEETGEILLTGPATDDLAVIRQLQARMPTT